MAVTIAFVLGGAEVRFQAAQLAEQLASDWDIRVVEPSLSEAGAIAFGVGVSQVVLAPMGAPYPAAELASFAKTSLLWPNAEEEVEGLAWHAILTVFGEGTSIERANLMTKVLSSLFKLHADLAGVLSGTEPQLVRSDLYQDMVASAYPETFPTLLWVQIRVGRSESGLVRGFTSGLAGLDLLDFETADSTEVPEALFDRLFMLATYVIEHGDVIQDGHTVGADEAERIKVRRGASQHGAECDVLHLEYQKPKRAQWKFWQ